MDYARKTLRITGICRVLDDILSLVKLIVHRFEDALAGVHQFVGAGEYGTQGIILFGNKIGDARRDDRSAGDQIPFDLLIQGK